MPKQNPFKAGRVRILAEFRYQLRNFLQFSEAAAHKVGLEPQQHQLLLQIAGAPVGIDTTIGYLANRLGLRHNTVVELSKRCEKSGLIVREHDDSDRRFVILRLTAKGERVLNALSLAHARELNELAPKLVHTLASLKKMASRTRMPRKREKN